MTKKFRIWGLVQDRLSPVNVALLLGIYNLDSPIQTIGS
jgi:hypothetical protein